MAKRPSVGLSDFEKRQLKRAAKAARKYARQRLAKKRHRVEKSERKALQLRDRAKQIRAYVSGFDAADGYDLRRPKSLTAKQKKKIERVYKQLAPLILKPHVRVRAQTKTKLRALKEFQRIEHTPRGMKAVPIITPSPDSTRVTVDADGVVTMRRGRTIQEFYFVPDGLKRAWNVESVAAEMLADMPAGQYFILTGEHEAYTAPVLHDPADFEEGGESLVLRQLKSWLRTYTASRVRQFFRGFRRIGRIDDVEKVFAEQARFRKRRKLVEKMRRERQRGIEKVSRRRARRQVPK